MQSVASLSMWGLRFNHRAVHVGFVATKQHYRFLSEHFVFPSHYYKVVQIWPGLIFFFLTIIDKHCTAAAQCGLFTHKSVPVIFEPPCTPQILQRLVITGRYMRPVSGWETNRLSLAPLLNLPYFFFTKMMGMQLKIFNSNNHMAVQEREKKKSLRTLGPVLAKPEFQLSSN